MVIGLIKLLHTIQILMQYRWNTLWNHPENWLYFPMQNLPTPQNSVDLQCVVTIISISSNKPTTKHKKTRPEADASSGFFNATDDVIISGAKVLISRQSARKFFSGAFGTSTARPKPKPPAYTKTTEA